ncbi:Protein N-acetyltransferase, RimJ/RimL family [Paenibacillus sp. OK060]|uniref:GNAT family N-acetyltransferase n=1 Tax=Paenibacillus sp. OK060 TaxID=1881034 RepID=UPI0008873133|nr:GNAT family N-acetyltransferase [Paenibacillus sp. OK060]SDL26969.1 Protein N-acetyltransferase, RimJ/RimL family [Paenibacillus sp. OK060]
MKRPTFLETERLVFSTWNEEDRALASALWGDHEVSKWISSKGFLSEDEVEARLTQELKRQEDVGVQYWPLFEKDSEVFVGCCGLRPYSPEEEIYELGFHLTRDHWGKGYAMEAAGAVIDYAFGELKAKALFAGHHPDNEVSRHMLSKLGFEYVRDERYEPTGLMHPSYLLKKE